ncbi:MAG: FAD-dependent oxidoreductase [Vicinamibacterales bacterium]
MTKLNADVLVIGGSAAGVTAAHDAGLDVVVVEARERIGGRIFTRPDSATPVPIELGAEFIYGSAPELTHVLPEASLSSVDVGGERWTTMTDGCVRWEPGHVEIETRKLVRRPLRSRSGFSRRRPTNLARSRSFPTSGRSRKPPHSMP